MEFVPAKTLITRTKNTMWFGTEYNMNIYRGCCHGCIYCDSRSECYGVEEFDRVRIKKDALPLIDRQLASKRKKGVVATGAMSDPYNPFEQKYDLTGQALSLIDKHRFGVAIATKSNLVARDIGRLKAIASHSPVLVKVTVTAASDSLSKKIELGAPPSSLRFEAIRKLREAGIFAGVLLMPVLPFIEDTEENIKSILKQANDAGAQFVYPGLGVTLRQNQRDYFLYHVNKLFPGMASRYIRRYGSRYSCGANNAKILHSLIAADCAKHGMLYRMADIIAAYRTPYQTRQLSFFR